MKTQLFYTAFLSIFFFQNTSFLIAQNQFSISGKVVEFDDSPVENAKVFLSDDVFTFTDENGNYTFEELEGGLDYSIQISKTEFDSSRINAFDYLELGKIVSINGPTGSYNLETFSDLKYDITGDHQVGSFDKWFVSAMALSNDTLIKLLEFPDSWKFYEQNFSPEDTFQEAHLNNTIYLESLSENKSNIDFYGILSGDLVDSRTFKTEDTPIKIEMQDLEICSDIITMPVKISSEKNFVGGQFTISFDSTLLKIVNNLSIFNQYPKSGEMNIFFILYNKNEYEFELKFKALDPDISETEIKVDIVVDPVLFLSEDKKIFPVEIVNGKVNYASPMLFANIDQLEATFDCSNESIELCLNPTGGVPPYEIRWEDGTQTNCNSFSSSKVIKYLVRDAVGCESSFTETLTINEPPNFNLGPHRLIQPTTNNSSDGAIRILNVSGGVPPYRFDWSNGATTMSISDVPAREYILYVIDANECIYPYYFNLTAQTTSNSKEIDLESSFVKISPNPSSNGNGIIEIEAMQNQSGKIEIFDLSGKKISHQNILLSIGSNQIAIDQKLQKGVYLINTTLEKDGRKTLKWVIQ